MRFFFLPVLVCCSVCLTIGCGSSENVVLPPPAEEEQQALMEAGEASEEEMNDPSMR